MITKVTTIAYNTFRENIREKILYSILMFALGFALVSAIISQWSLNQEARLMLDFGLTIISVFGLLIATFLGIGLVSRELEKRTVYLVLSKPVSRSLFLTGKYFGLVLTMLIVFIMMAIGFLIVYGFFQGVLDFRIFTAITASFFQMCIMIAVALLFSTFASPMVSAILTLFVYAAGFFSADIMLLDPGVKSSVFQSVLKIFYFIVPNLSLLNLRPHVVHDIPIEGAKVMAGVLHAIAYSLILFAIAALIFNRRNLK